MSKKTIKDVQAMFNLLLPFAEKDGKIFKVDWYNEGSKYIKAIYDKYNQSLDELKIDIKKIKESEKPYYRGLMQNKLAEICGVKPALVKYGG